MISSDLFKINVPYVAPSANVILLILLIIINSSPVDGQQPNEAQADKQIPPQRPHPAEMIHLEDGATTFTSSLEEYLASSTTTTTSTSTTETPGPLVTAKSASLLAGQSGEDRKADLHHPLESHQEAPASPPPPPPPETRHGAEHNDHHHHQANQSTAANKPIPQHYQVKSLLNVTHDYPLAYSQVICGYVWPLMAALTLFTNLMIVFVLTQRDMRTPTNVVLTAIAIADIIPIVVPVPWFVYLFAMGNEKQVLYPPVACYFYQHSTRSVSEIFYFLSTWLNVLLAIQDYLVACWPKLAKKYCQIKVVIIEIISLTLLAFLLNLPQALKIVYKPVKFYYNGQLTWGCKALQAKWFKDLVGDHVALYDDIFTSIIVLFVDGGPAIVLITLTALLIKQLQRQRIKGHLLMEQARTASKRRRERHRQQEYESSARVMIFVLLAFLAVKIPFATTYTLMIIQSRFNIRFVENLVDFQKAITLTDLVFVLSYPINFTIFCCCSKKFRHKCAQLLGECNDSTRTTRDRLWSSFSEQSGLNSLTDSQSIISRKNARGGENRNDSLATISSRQEFLDILANKRESLGSILSSNAAKVNGTTAIGRQDNDRTLLHHNDNAREVESVNQENNSLICGNESDNHHACASYNLQQLERNQALAHVNFKALLEDGNLCLECIMRYEHLRKSSMVATHQDTTSQSVDSSSWAAICQRPVTPPPPPVPLSPVYLQQQQHQQLPSIVTTWCESIRENSSDETNGSASQLGANEEEPSRQQRPPQQAADSIDEVSGQSGDDRSAERDRWDAGLLAGSLGRSANSVDATTTGKGAEKKSKSRGLDKSLLMGRPRRVQSAARNSSDPGPAAERMQLMSKARQKQQQQQQPPYDTITMNSGDSSRRASSNEGTQMSPSDERTERHSKGKKKEKRTRLTLSLMENRQRSLSLSNSNLSTLPNATGMLADMFVTALMGASQHGSIGGSQRSCDHHSKGE